MSLRSKHIKNRIGDIYGRLTVVSFDETSPPKIISWICKCSCGKEVSVRSNQLSSGKTKSCGCIHKEQLAQRNFDSKKHGKSVDLKDRTYRIWVGMRSRCNNSKMPEFKNYGARGISVDSRWDDFLNFLEDMGPRPPGMSIERKNVNEGYSKENCKWATTEEQANNKRTNVVLAFNGKVLTLAQWAKELDMKYETLARRYRAGKSVEEILNPVLKRN